MSKKESKRSLIESLAKENSDLHDTIGELQGIAIKYDTLVQALDDAIMADTYDVYIHGSSVLSVYKALEPYHYSHMISKKQKDKAGES